MTPADQSLACSYAALVISALSLICSGYILVIGHVRRLQARRRLAEHARNSRAQALEAKLAAYRQMLALRDEQERARA